MENFNINKIIKDSIVIDKKIRGERKSGDKIFQSMTSDEIEMILSINNEEMIFDASKLDIECE